MFSNNKKIKLTWVPKLVAISAEHKLGATTYFFLDNFQKKKKFLHMTFDLKVVSIFNAYQRIYLSGFALIDFYNANNTTESEESLTFI